MRRARFVAALFILSACAHSFSGREMLPPDITERFHAGHFRGFREPPLWLPEAARGYRTRLRVTASGIAFLKGSVRIDQHDDGRITGHVVTIDGPEQERSARSFRASHRDVQEIVRIAEEGRIWSIHPQFWVLADPDDICIDGIDVVLERVDSAGYRFSQANVSCAAPHAFRRIAERMFEIAREERLKRLLR